MTKTSTTPAAPTPLAAAQRGPRRAHLWVAVLLVLALPAALVGAALWALRGESGSAWLLAQVPRLSVEQPSGALLGTFSAKRIVVHLDDATDDRIVIDAPRWSTPRLKYVTGSPIWFAVALESFSAQRVTLQLASSDKSPSLPTDLLMPIQLDVAALRIDDLVLPGLDGHPLRDVRTHLQLGADNGREHRLDELSLRAGALQLRGQARIGAESPMPLGLRFDVTQSRALDATDPAVPAWAKQALRDDWQAHFSAQGPLARFEVQATLRAQGQSLDAKALVTPVEAWPVAQLDARIERLDLSALLAGAPATALTGKVHITPAQDGTRRLSAQADLTNHNAGRWDAQRLPLRSISLQASGALAQPQRVEVTALDAVLAADGRDAGTLQGSVFWEAGAFKLEARLGDVQPGTIDARLAAVNVSGPVTLSGRFDTPMLLQVQADLRGHAGRDASRMVRVKFDVAGHEQHFELREFLATSGAAKATLQGSAQRSAAGAPWRVAGHAALADFDPLVWFPAPAGSSWRAGPHRLTAQAEFALDLPAALVQPGSRVERWRHLGALRGNATLRLTDSLLAGVPMSGELSLRSNTAGRAQVNSRADLAGNLVQAVGELDAQTQGRADHWDISANAPALARLTPWLRLAPPSTFLTGALAGVLKVQAKVDGRWPDLRTQGQLQASALRAGDTSLGRAEMSWQFAPQAEAPLEVRADLAQVSQGRQQLNSASLLFRGSARAHSVELHAQLKAVPPAWALALQGNGAELRDKASTLLHVLAQGSIVEQATGSAPADARNWRGTLRELDVRGNAPSAAPWLRAQDVAIELRRAGATRPWAIAVSPGRAEVLGAALHWQRFAWQGGDGGRAATVVELDAELEPLPLAPLLVRVQPEFGWGGDLAIGGHIKLRSAPNFSADVVLERARGDLSVTDEIGTQALGLTDLRMALAARDGVWAFTQGLAGKTLGVAAGAVTARVAPEVMWPPADTPIQGVLEAQVANLGTWGAWVPAGWRLGGNLRTSAVIGGRFGAPEYTGEMRGSGISVRNAVQGVNVSDGEVAVNLQGASARIERFEAKSGAGSVRLEGSASLGEAPKAQLRLVAERFQLLGRVDRRIIASGTAQLALDAQTLSLDGRFGVDEGLVDFSRGDAPGLADDVVVSGRKNAETRPAAATGRARAVTLNLQVELGQRLRVRGRGLDTGLRGELRLTAPAGKLAVNGSVRTADGTYAAYGQKLDIDRGVLAFSGLAENPRLDIEATRPNLDLRVGVAVTGTALNPRVRLFSEPEMSDTDKLSWLVLGRAPDGLGRTDTALLQRAALALLAGEGAGHTDPVTKAIGLDDVSVRQTEGDVRETVVSLGKQLSRRWYVGYERGLNATTGTWQLIYRIAQRFTLRAQSGLDNSLDVIWTWRWQ